MTAALPWPLSVPVLSDGTVTLRAHTPADVDAMFAMAQDPDMQRWTTVPADNTREQTEHFALTTIPQGWNEGQLRSWAIESGGEYAGTVDIRGTGVSSIGFALHPRARGRGIMSAAVRLAIGNCFDDGFCEAVQWQAHVGNLASLRVAHACGFRLIAEIPALLFDSGRAIDGWQAVLTFGDPMFPRRPWRGDTELEAITAQGRRLRLRPPTFDDVMPLTQACADPASRHWLYDIEHDPSTLHRCIARWWWHAATGQQATWVIADATTNLALGRITVADMLGIDETAGEIGYLVHPDARGQGIVSAALSAVIDHAFDPGGLDRRRLTAAAAEGNHASLAALRSAGFQTAGLLRRAEPLGDGTFADLHEFDLLR